MMDEMQLLDDLGLLAELGALEIMGPDEQGICRIPYMMNDAVEIYYEFKDCACNGLPEGTFPEETVVSIEQGDNRQGICLNYGEHENSWLWFQNYEKHSHYYQYHRIGHFWIDGQEHWRQLVYMIGTIYDKLTFLGEEGCNDEEMAILGLVTFAPFRYFSPVDESLESRYPDAEIGLKQMMTLADEVGDEAFLKLLKRYQKMISLPVIGKKIVAETIRAMNMPERQPLYQHIYEKVCHASARWEERHYDKAMDKKIHALREKTDADLKAEGYTGEYPYYQKETETITVAEEHPFTVMDDDFDFKIHLMISQTPEPAGINAGFFDGREYQGKIIKDIYKNNEGLKYVTCQTARADEARDSSGFTL